MSTDQLVEKGDRYGANVQLFMFFLGWRYRSVFFALGSIYIFMAGALVAAISGGGTPLAIGIVGLILGGIIGGASLAFEVRFRHFVDLAGQFIRGQDNAIDPKAVGENRTYFQRYVETPGAPTQTSVIRILLSAHIIACVGVAGALFRMF